MRLLAVIALAAARAENILHEPLGIGQGISSRAEPLTITFNANGNPVQPKEPE